MFAYVQKSSNIEQPNQYPSTWKIQSTNVAKVNKIPITSSPIRCIICARFRSGRFGNRMFTIATAYALARLHACHLFFPVKTVNEMKSVFIFNVESLLLHVSIVKSMLKNATHPMKRITRDIICQYIPEIMNRDEIPQGSMFEVKGHWQSYLHFEKYRDELRNRIFIAKQSAIETVSELFINAHKKRFNIKPQFTLDNYQSFKQQLAESNWTTWIGIHVRRSDFISLDFASSDEYLFSAIEYFTDRYPNAHFIVASDDKRYCKNLFHNRENIFITPNSFSVGDDLVALSLCEHSIITGGTFGWWAGYLASGEVIHDTKYLTGCEKDEHYYPPWFRTLTITRKLKST